MSERKQSETIARFVNLVRGLSLQRYRLGIVCGEISSGKSKIARFASEQLQARYIDLAIELLPQTTMPNFTPTLGAYGPDNLIKWILHQSDKPDTPFLVADQIEPLLATFGRAQVVHFFRMIGQVEPRRPTILVTYLKRELEEAAFPAERLLNL